MCTGKPWCILWTCINVGFGVEWTNGVVHQSQDSLNYIETVSLGMVEETLQTH